MRKYVITKLQKYFKENWNHSDIAYDTNAVEDFKENYIKLKIIPSDISMFVIGEKRLEGTLRIFIHSKNPTDNFDLADKLYEFLEEETIYDIYVKEDGLISSPSRKEASEDFVSVYDFSFCYKFS